MAAVLASFKGAYASADPQPPRLPFSLNQAITYRLTSLQQTYREWSDGGAGFIFNFDPERGYDAPARGFGAAFNAVAMGESRETLEYGFTGRQLNAAYVLADRGGDLWRGRGRRVVDSYLDHCATPSGWLYTIYHLAKGRPVYTCGDPDGPVMHYLARSSRPGNYTRMMVEAAYDLLLNCRLYREFGDPVDRWLAACRGFADFLVAHQNADGSWYRAYTPAGDPIRDDVWFGGDETEARSATAIPIAYLLAFAEEAGPDKGTFLAAARLAGSYLLTHNVVTDFYAGGTLDNPNIVDKEAAMYAMHALLALYDAFQAREYLEGAHRAAKLAITWNFLWNVPPVPGTRLAGAGVASTGWGGINSVWGAGVTDIYSLFMLADFVRVSQLTGEPLYAAVADLVAHGTQQILSYPGNLFGFAGIGMQPEGIAFSNQGVDDGLIAKGDIWGGLGWIYTAGTFGLHRYLKAKGDLPKA